MVSSGGADELPAKGGDHESGVDAVLAELAERVDGAAISDLRGLQAKVVEEGLYDGATDGEGAGVGADADAEQTPQLAQDDGEEGHEPVDDEFRPEGAEAHTCYADEGEEADY